MRPVPKYAQRISPGWCSLLVLMLLDVARRPGEQEVTYHNCRARACYRNLGWPSRWCGRGDFTARPAAGRLCPPFISSPSRIPCAGDSQRRIKGMPYQTAKAPLPCRGRGNEEAKTNDREAENLALLCSALSRALSPSLPHPHSPRRRRT